MALSINRSALVMHSSERMYDLVNSIESYPEFLPWCSNSRVLSRGDDFMLASIEVAKGAVKQSFTTRNDLSEPGKIALSLVDGPFNYLSGEWFFHTLRDDACKVELILNFELKTSIAKMAFGPVFNQAANSMVDAFCQQADQVYGKQI